MANAVENEPIPAVKDLASSGKSKFIVVQLRCSCRLHIWCMVREDFFVASAGVGVLHRAVGGERLSKVVKMVNDGELPAWH